VINWFVLRLTSPQWPCFISPSLAASLFALRDALALLYFYFYFALCDCFLLLLFRGDFNAGCSLPRPIQAVDCDPQGHESSAQPELDTSHRRTLAKSLKKGCRVPLFCKRRADAFADWCPEWIMTTVSCKKVINLWKRLIWLMKFVDLNYWTWCCVVNRWSLRDP